MAVLFLLLASSAGRADPASKTPAATNQKRVTAFDFVVMLHECKSMSTSLSEVTDIAKEQVHMQTKAEGLTMTCDRSGKRSVRCRYKFADPKSKEVTADYTTITDSSALLVFSEVGGSDVVYVDPSLHSAVLVSHFFIDVVERRPVVMSKMCKGFYLTYDEADAIRNKSDDSGIADPFSK